MEQVLALLPIRPSAQVVGGQTAQAEHQQQEQQAVADVQRHHAFKRAPVQRAQLTDGDPPQAGGHPAHDQHAEDLYRHPKGLAEGVLIEECGQPGEGGGDHHAGQEAVAQHQQGGGTQKSPRGMVRGPGLPQGMGAEQGGGYGDAVAEEAWIIRGQAGTRH